MITVHVNGKETEVADDLTVSRLLEVVDLPKPYLAVEINAEVVPRQEHGSRRVVAGDQIEVVTLVGGG